MNEARIFEVVQDLWAKSRGGRLRLAESVSETLAHHPELPLEEKAAAVRRFYRVIKMRLRTDVTTVDVCEPDDGPVTRFRIRYAATLVSAGVVDAGFLATFVPQHVWDSFHAAEAELDSTSIDPAVFSRVWSIPEFLAADLIRELGSDAAAFMASANHDAPVTLRVNTAKITRDELLERLRARDVDVATTSYSPLGITIRSPFSVFTSPEFTEGLMEMQDEASQLAVLAAAPPPQGRVADLCAGAGGKSLGLAAEMRGKGRILSVDISERRLEELRRRARRAGAHQIRAILTDAGSWPEEVSSFVRSAHRVWLDVPCTGIGSLRRHADMRHRVRESDLSRLPVVQSTLLERTVPLLAAGSRLIYSTCTTRRAENEEVIDRLCAASPELELVRVTEILGGKTAAPITDPTGTYLKLMPHIHGTDGFFLAVLRRRS